MAGSCSPRKAPGVYLELNGSRIEARAKRGVINECGLFRAERFQLVPSKQSCSKGGRSPAMIHTENPKSRFALVNIKTYCCHFPLPSLGKLVSFRPKFKGSLEKAALFFYLQIKITRCNNNAKLGERQASSSLSGWACDGNFPFCTRSISRKDFSYHCSNSFFFFFLRERRHLREAAGLCATHAIPTALHTLEPASNLAQCQPVLAVWCGDQEWVPLPVGSGLCCLCPVPIKSRAPPGAL